MASSNMKRVLVTGADGYIGSVLRKHLLNDSWDVRGVDTMFYSNVSLFPVEYEIPIIKKDIREINQQDIRDIDAVIYLADLNDPTSQLYPEQTKAINLEGIKTFATLCKANGVKRFLYSSSASVYGFSDDMTMDEASTLNPLTPYAECKVAMEKYLQELNDNNFLTACMRNATGYGLSPHMRFDLVINYLCGSSVADNVIRLKSDGTAWRPFVHIDDLCNAFTKILGLPDTDFSGLVVNVGNGNSGNHRVIDIANIIRDITRYPIEIAADNKDGRSYKLNTDRLEGLGITCDRNIREAIQEMIEFLTRIGLTSDTLHDSSFHRTDRIRELLAANQINDELYWR